MQNLAIAMIGALAAASIVFAQESAQPASTPATTAPVAAAASETSGVNGGSQSQQAGARPSADTVKQARQLGYALKTSTKTGTYVFCKTDAQLGTRLESTKCMEPEMLMSLLQQMERDKNYLQSRLAQSHCNDRGCT
jgi:hypothetical protein